MAGQRAVESAELAMLGVTASEDALETAIETLDPAASDDVDLNGMDHLGNEVAHHPEHHQGPPVADLHPGGGAGVHRAIPPGSATRRGQ